MTRQQPINYRGFSIEHGTGGSFGVYLLGWIAGFATVAAAKAYIDRKRG